MDQPAHEALKPWLELVQQNNARKWRENFKSLFLEAKDYYPDVVWVELLADGHIGRRVWGHQAVILAKASPQSLDMYLPDQTKSQPDATRETSLASETSTCRLNTIPEAHYKSLVEALRSFYDPEFGPVLFRRGIRGFFSDVQINIAVEPTNGSNDSAIPAVFYGHRFILSFRSPYFRFHIAEDAHPTMTLVITLPSPIFTPDSLYHILLYIYGGTPTNICDILTAFSIFRGSVYLDLHGLEELMLSHIAVDILHGLFHAPLSDTAYAKLVSEDWTNMVNLGCICPSCARHAPQVLQFALEDGVDNGILERGARRALVGLFGEGWCTEQFSALPEDVMLSVLENTREVITLPNIFPLLFAAESALLTLNNDNSNQDWTDLVRAKIISIRVSIDRALCANAQTLFESETWRHLMMGDQSDNTPTVASKTARVRYVLWSISRVVNPANVATLHQAVMFGINLNKRRALFALPHTPRTRMSGMQVEFLKFMYHLAASESPFPHILPMDLNGPRPINKVQRGTDSSRTSFINSSSAASFYSCVSMLGSVSDLEDPLNARYNANAIAALDLATVSSKSFSLASSRTISTDYGIYYTRRAISREAIRDWESSRSTFRRRSFDSVLTSTE